MNENQPLEALPELPIPEWVDNTKLCNLIPGAGRPIWAEGFTDGRVGVVLDNPGARETSDGKPFVCGTRQTLLESVMEVGIDTHELYVTFLLKCWPRRKYNRESAWQAGVPLLKEQLRSLHPQVLLFLGNTVVQAFSDLDGEVKSLRGQVWEYEDIPVVVTYHPLAIRRRPNLRRVFLTDLQRAAAYLV